MSADSGQPVDNPDSAESVESDGPPSLLLDYLRLMRLPNVFTAIADVMMGYLVVHQKLTPVGPLLLLITGSALLYTAGMILNDVFDIEVDRRERPQRPLPSGRISLGLARVLGFGMLALGVMVAGAGGVIAPAAGSWAWRPLAIAVAIAACVLAYDGFLKKTPLGPLGMGGCRFFNVLLGMSVGAAATPEVGPALGFANHQLVVAAGIGVYIVGVTWFARREAEVSQVTPLVLSTAVMAGGIACLGFLHRLLPVEIEPMFNDELYWWLLLGMVSFTILRRCNMAIFDPRPEHVQAAVKHGILSLIVLDAAVSLEMAGPVPAIGVLLLLAPTVGLGLWVYST